MMHNTIESKIHEAIEYFLKKFDDIEFLLEVVEPEDDELEEARKDLEYWAESLYLLICVYLEKKGLKEYLRMFIEYFQERIKSRPNLTKQLYDADLQVSGVLT